MPRPRSAQARHDALTAATEVVLELGVDGFSVDEVVRRSGVAKTTVYRHWENGQNLLFAAIEAVIVPEPQPDNGSLQADLDEMGRFMLALPPELMIRSRRIFAGLLNGSIDDPAVAALLDQLREERRRPVYGLVRRAVERGEIDERFGISPALDIAVDVVIGPFFSRVLTSDVCLTETDVELWVEMAMRALGARQ